MIRRLFASLLCAWLVAAIPARVQPVAQPTSHLYLPLVSNPARITGDAPIWAHAQVPAAHEVVLFRENIYLDSPLSGAQLHIFADTRYEAWLDGAWLGRGPARFSRTLREFDVHALGDLPPGEHLLAVLVQWAPNIRRSESTTPYLLAHVEGARSGSLVALARSGPGWLSLPSDAWRKDATPVHAWGLIGPTELLDFSRLPAGWNQPAYSADNWTPAVVKDISQVSFQPLQVPPLEPGGPVRFSTLPSFAAQSSSLDLESVTFRHRSIPFLANVPITITLADAGALSPGLAMGELSPPYPANPLLNFSLPTTLTFTVETLTPFSPTMRLDGNPLPWQAQGAQRPDTWAAVVALPGGEHSISYSNLPPGGVTFAASSAGVSYSQFPFQQGAHAGRRLLLADPQSDPSRVHVLNTQPLSLVFQPGQNYALLDLGRSVHGRLQATLNGPAGALIDIGWDERLSADGRPLPYPGSLHPEWNQVDSWVLDGQERQLTTLDTRAGRYLLIAVWANQPVTLSNIQVYEERFPSSLRASFTSSNALLDQVWQVGVQTLYPNRTDAYSDTPWRERGQWWGDAYVAEQVQRVTFGDNVLLRRGLEFMADTFSQSAAPGAAPNANGTHILDFSMLWVNSLAEYHTSSSDSPLLDQLFPQVRAFMNHLATYENASTGLLDLPADDWWHTVYIESLGQASRVGQSMAANALYYNTLLQASFLAEEQGDIPSAQAWQQKAGRVYQSTNQLLYLPNEKRYLSSLVQGLPIPPSPQAQAWALAYGLVPTDQQEYVVTALVDSLSTDPAQPNLDVYGMFWVLQALGKSGHISEALEIIENYYGYMLAGGATTWWEKFNAAQMYPASLSHSWGGSPTWFLTTYVLGARQTGPQTWELRPALQGVDFASGSLPLPGGDLLASWRTTCQQVELQVASPAASNGQIFLPGVNQAAAVYLNGEPLAGQAADAVIQQPDGLQISLQSGAHHLTIQLADQNLPCPMP